MQKDDHPVTAADLKDDYRTVAKASRLSEATQIADQTVRNLGIICSMRKVADDNYILGSYNQIGRWSRKTKECQIEGYGQGGIWAYKEVDGYQLIVPDSNNVCVAQEGQCLYQFGNGQKGTYIKGHHNMGRNVVFTEQYLYFVSKKGHRLIQIDIKDAIEKAKSGQNLGKDQEDGKAIAYDVADFCVDADGQVYVISEESIVEAIGQNYSRRC